MNILLAAINAKYIHSNLGIYTLKAYGESRMPGLSVEIGEYTINHRMDTILQDIYERKPDFLGFSCYIWNIEYVMGLVKDISHLLPGTRIWLGGPEVSFRAREILEQEPGVEGVMIGEGEETFGEVLSACSGTLPWEEVKGIAFRREGEIFFTGERGVISMDQIPFPYQNLEGFENRIIYYETSRGCPFSCSYCLSSIDKSVRFRSLELVYKELEFFLERKVPQVKFIDRTFNCKKSHSMAIWKYILEHDNGVTNFHFEITADLLDEEELELLSRMRPGLVQLEIGVQTTNPRTIEEIRRKMDLSRLSQVVKQINQGNNVHQHLDLIAGLPYENYDSFHQSFDDVYHMEPEQLQLGFLKVLQGSYMAQMADSYGLIYQSAPPYEVLSTRWLPYEDVIRLKGIEDMVEVYYNSHQFTYTVKELGEEWGSPFTMFEKLASYYRDQGLSGISHSRLARYEIMFRFVENQGLDVEKYRDLLMYDLYLRENVKSRPSFAPDMSPYREELKPYRSTSEQKRHLHGEVMGDGRIVLFDYEKRDPLTYNAQATVVGYAGKGRVREILRRLDKEYGTEYRCFLEYETPWQLLIAVILSAQCTDARVNLVTRELFRKYDSLEKFAKADLKELEQDIHSTGFYHTKARNIIACCKELVETYSGKVPSDMEALTSLAGVGRKTANVIRGNIYHQPSIVVDTHVKRISRKLGLTEETDPEKVEYQLMEVLPEERWILWNIHIITLGRTICTARNPKCRECFLQDLCPGAEGKS